MVIDPQGSLVWANETAERTMGRDRSEWVGSSGLALIHPDDLHMAALSLSTVTDKEVGSPIEVRIATAAGWRLAEVIGAPIGDGMVLLSMRDLTQRRRWEIAGDDVARFRSLVHNAATLTMLVRSDGTITSVSAAVTRLLGHDPEAVTGRPLASLVAEEDHAALDDAIAKAISGSSAGGGTVVEVSLRSRDERTVPYELTLVSLLDDPTVEGLVVSGHDITRLRAAQESLAELAHFDPLTGLPNRRAFEADLERHWNLARHDAVESYVLVADLDGFKALNDRHGHAAGDAALREFASTLRLAARESDVVARLGGDEFAIILARGGENAVVSFSARLRRLMDHASSALTADLEVTVGHAPLRTSDSPSDALHRADLAMLAAKRAPKT